MISGMSAIGTKRTSRGAPHMSAFDPKRTSPGTDIKSIGREIHQRLCARSHYVQL